MLAKKASNLRLPLPSLAGDVAAKATRRFGVTALLGGGALMALLGSTPSARADVILPSTLTVPNDALSGTAGPYGTVDVLLNSPTSATVTFTADSGYYFIDSSIADVEVNATSFTVGSFSATAAPGSTGTASNLAFGGSGNVASFGVFNLTNDNMGGTDQALTQVDFDITDTSGIWSSAANVLTTNADGFDAAAHVVVCTGAVQGCGSNSTGFVAETSTAPMPEPTTLALLGTGLVGLGLLANRRRRHHQK